MFAQIRTKNPSAGPLRRSISVPCRAVVRLGSRTATEECFRDRRGVIEVNTVESISNSRDKLRMKDCFARFDVPQAEWWTIGSNIQMDRMPYPLVGKQICGFKGHGMQLLNNMEELNTFLHSHGNSYFIERFYNYAKEYRIHATRDHAFLAWRKLRRSDATERWFFNSTNCNWVGVDHELFARPNNWSDLEAAAINSVRAVGLDIGAVDIRVQSQQNPDFIVCEVNSAPQLGEAGIEAYKREIRNIIINKHDGR